MQKSIRFWFGITASAAFLALAPAAFANSNSNSSNQAQGVTSGPASGSPVVPNTAAEKHANNSAAAGVGAPGATAKQGTEAGPAPNTNTAQNNGSNQK